MKNAYSGGQSDDITDRAFVLHMTDLCFIPDIPYGSGNPQKYFISSEPRVNLEYCCVAPKEKNLALKIYIHTYPFQCIF